MLKKINIFVVEHFENKRSQESYAAVFFQLSNKSGGGAQDGGVAGGGGGGVGRACLQKMERCPIFRWFL
jgi:hypothetical protein